MKRTLIALMAVTFAAASANAASVVVSSSSGSTISPAGGLITLSVAVTVAPADGLDGSLFGALTYPSVLGSLVGQQGTQSAFVPVLPGTPFGLGALSCTTARCVMFSQVAGAQGPQAGNVAGFVIATQNVTVPALPAGTVLNWNWQTTPSTQRLDFFGAVADVPALSITVVPIPEPTTAALLGLGLVGLSVAGRRRA
jgi:hypothetical protein